MHSQEGGWAGVDVRFISNNEKHVKISGRQHTGLRSVERCKQLTFEQRKKCKKNKFNSFSFTKFFFFLLYFT